MKKPEIDIGGCTLCLGCVAIYPEAFRCHDAGYMETVELAEYSEKDVEAAMMFCPEDCIVWVDE